MTATAKGRMQEGHSNCSVTPEEAGNKTLEMERRRQLLEAFGGTDLPRMITWFLADTEYKGEGEIKYNHKVPGLDHLLSVILLKKMDRTRRSKQIIRENF